MGGLLTSRIQKRRVDGITAGAIDEINDLGLYLVGHVATIHGYVLVQADDIHLTLRFIWY